MLSVVTADKASEIIRENFSFSPERENLPLRAASGRVVSDDILSPEDVPAFDRSTVDGFALKAGDTYGCSENMPAMLKIKGEILMGQEPSEKISAGECMKISTGGMLPEGADSVIMCEYTDSGFDGTCLCLKSVSPRENVISKGDDIKKGRVILPRGSVIDSSFTGVLSALGITRLDCVKKPVAGIISTGDEIVSCNTFPGPGQVRNVNSALLMSLLEENGCEAINYGIVKDHFENLCDTFSEALSECDFVILSGGSSKGERDMTAKVFSRFGELLFHGLAMKPGKPTILASCSGKAVFGLPGHPAAAYFVARRLILPFVNHITGCIEKPKSAYFRLGSDIPSNHGREEVLPVRIVGREVFPVYGKSGIVSMLSESDGYIIIDRNKEGAFLGEETEVFFI